MISPAICIPLDSQSTVAKALLFTRKSAKSMSISFFIFCPILIAKIRNSGQHALHRGYHQVGDEDDVYIPPAAQVVYALLYIAIGGRIAGKRGRTIGSLALNINDALDRKALEQGEGVLRRVGDIVSALYASAIAYHIILAGIPHNPVASGIITDGVRVGLELHKRGIVSAHIVSVALAGAGGLGQAHAPVHIGGAAAYGVHCRICTGHR